MSYRDLRNFTEMMRALGYPRLISMENFRTPNFALVAEVLQWLVLRYDPNADLPMDVDTENDRVIFIKSVAQFMATKAHIKLNTKKLYSADGYAVKELLKVTSVLYNAMKSNSSDEESGSDEFHTPKIEVLSKIGELKIARQLASEITSKGAALFDLLGHEVELREYRNGSVARQMDLNEIEKNIKSQVNNVIDDVHKTRSLLENIASDEANLEAKISKKKQEYERNQKRLRSLESVRPAFMDEYEKLEVDLQGLYEVYIEKFRNLTYLEQLLEESNKSEQEKLEEMEAPLKAVARAKFDENTMLTNSLDVENSDSNSDNDEEELLVENPKRNRPQPAKPGGKVIGSMDGGIDSDEGDTEDLSSGDSEIGMDDDDEDDEEEEDDDDDLIDGNDYGKAGGRKRADLVDSDNDF